jgi:hypothetical protein
VSPEKKMGILVRLLIAAILLHGSTLAGVTARSASRASDDKDAKQGPNKAQGSDYTVEARRVKPIPSDPAPLFEVEFTYEFRKRSSVRLKGVGLLPAAGTYSFIVAEPTLVFEDPAGNWTVTVPLKPTTAPEGGAPELPEPKAFPEQGLNDSSPAPDLFTAVVLTVLNRHFRAGYTINQENGQTYFRTTYADVSGMPPKRDGQIALLISFPSDAPAGAVPFRVQYLARVKPTKSDTYDNNIDAASQKAVDAFLSTVISELKTK